MVDIQTIRQQIAGSFQYHMVTYQFHHTGIGLQRNMTVPFSLQYIFYSSCSISSVAIAVYLLRPSQYIFYSSCSISSAAIAVYLLQPLQYILL